MAILGLSPPIAGALGLLVLVFLTKPLWSRTQPGPLLAKYGPFWFIRQIVRGDFHLTSLHLHRKHGPFVQIMPGYISVDDPEAHKVIYSLQNAWGKADAYIPWRPGKGDDEHNLFSEIRVDRHAAMKRKIGSMYSLQALVSYEPFVNSNIDLLHGHFTRFSESQEVVDFAHWCQCFAFDGIMTVTFGERLGFLDKGEDCASLMKHIDSVQFTLNWLGAIPHISILLREILDKLSTDNTLAFMEWVQNKLRASKEAEQSEADGPAPMMKKFVDTQKSAEKRSLTDWEVLAHCGANVGAGSDSTAATMAAILYYIYQNKDVLERLRQEIRDAELVDRPDFRDVQQLPYLQAVMKEAFRMAPGAGMQLWRTVPSGGASIGDQYFPEGTSLGVNPWVAHHNPDIFGLDCDVYRPTRWLEGDESSLSAMESSLCNFGFANRSCIGKNISLLEITKVVPVLVRDFDINFKTALDKYGKPAPFPHTLNRWFIKVADLTGTVSRRAVA